MQAQWIQADGTVIYVAPQNGTDFSLEELKAFVHGYIEIIFFDNGQIMVVNEEGAINGMKPNEIASLTQNSIRQRFCQPIFGDALYCDRSMVK